MIVLEQELGQQGLNGLFKAKACKANDKRVKCGGKGTKAGRFLKKVKKIAAPVASIATSLIPVGGGTISKIINSKTGKAVGKAVKKGKNTVKQLEALKNQAVSSLTDEQAKTLSAITGINTSTKVAAVADASASTEIPVENFEDVQVVGEDVNNALTDAQAKTLAEIKDVSVDEIKPDSKTADDTPKTEEKSNTVLYVGLGLAGLAALYFATRNQTTN